MSNISGLFKPDIFLQKTAIFFCGFFGYPHDMTCVVVDGNDGELRESQPEVIKFDPQMVAETSQTPVFKLHFFEAQLRMAIGFTMITMKWKAFPARKRGREHHLSTAT